MRVFFEKEMATADARRDAINQDADRRAKETVDRAWPLTP